MSSKRKRLQAGFIKITKKSLVMLLAVSILLPSFSYLFLFKLPKTAKAEWFDDNWAYRKSVTLTVSSSSSDITNLEMKLTIDTSSATLGSGNIQSSCQDLRFTNIHGDLLPYYLDSGCSTSSTKVWVMADLVPKNTTTMIIYMYYGNPSAPAGSDSTKFDNVVGLKGYWTVNDGGSSASATDSSVSGNNGTLSIGGSGTQTTATQAWTNGASGQYSGSIKFDGTDDRISLGNQTALNISGTAITISAWIKTGSSGSAEQSIFSRRIQGSGTQYNFRLLSTNYLSFGWDDSGNNWQNHADTTTVLSTNTWYFVAATYNGSQVVIYVNGTAVATFSETGSLASKTNNNYIGFLDQTGNNSWFNGQIDDVKIYNTGRTAAQITADYTNTSCGGQTCTIATTAVATIGPSQSYASAEKSPGPVAYWKFDDGTGTTAQDSTSSNADGTLAGTTIPTWQAEDLCISGKCLFFDGTTSKVTVAQALGSVQTVSMWVKPNTSASTALIDLDGGTHKITTDASSVISATGFTSPTIYVNGKVSTTLTANQWNYVSVTTGTSFASTSSMTIGSSSTTFLKGFIDEVKIYPYARSAAQIQADFNARGTSKGSSATLGSNSETMKQLSNGLVGYWKMDESSGNRSDSSGNGNTLTDNNTVTTNPGKFGNAGQFTAANSEYLSLTSNSSVQVGDVDFSISGWFYLDSKGANRSLINKWTSGSSQEYYLLYESSTDRFQFTVSSSGTNQTDLSANNLGSPSTATWYFIIAWHDSVNNTINIQIDNGAVNSTSHSTGVYSGSAEFRVGMLNASGNAHNGRIDEVRFYKKVLTPAERTALYNFAPGPKVYLKMDEGTGTAANDSSGNANTGTVNSGTWTTGKYGKGVNVTGSSGSNVSVSDFSY